MKSLAEMTTTEILALTYADVVSRIQSGEWTVWHFEAWIEDKLNYAWGEAYDEAWDTVEAVYAVKGKH